MNVNQPGQVDAWEKWDWLWNGLYYVTVLISFALFIFNGDQEASAWVVGFLTAMMLVWHWSGLRLAYRDVETWEERSGTRVVVILGDIILWFALVNLSTPYYLALVGLFVQVFRHLPIRYAAFAAILLLIATLTEQVVDSEGLLTLTNPIIWIFMVMGLAAIGLGIWITAIIQQSSHRRQLIKELEETQAELAAAERREGILAERQRLAREIHDTLAQGFTSIYMHLEAAEQALPDDISTVQKHVDQARITAHTNLDQARRVVQDLRPDLLDQHSFRDAIDRTTMRWSEETGIPVTTTVTGDPYSLHPQIEITLLRATQEALNNIRKHAQASAVQLTLSYMYDFIILDIQDDGAGLNAAEPSPLTGGFGLKGMRERVSQCGGSVTLESEPGEGTTVVVTIPLSDTATDQARYSVHTHQ